ncbi:hypothetical protein ACIRPK_23765 [Kitasatospora sp. NPDC101801]|uniref:hypothetical protein n=1 Tax=Kitasatospora sp. NPDC101801 TaxID=3364103 RepID=UPI0038262F61
MQTPRDLWPWCDREAEYRRLFPVAIEAVAEILDVAVAGSGARLRKAGTEPVPAPWPNGQGPAPESPAGKIMVVWRSLPPTCISLPSEEERAAQWLVGLLNQAVWHASHGEWFGAADPLKTALRSAWKVTGYRA